MIEVLAAEFGRNLGCYEGVARHEPVVVTSAGSAGGYPLCPAEFEDYHCLKGRATRAYCVTELPQKVADQSAARLREFGKAAQATPTTPATAPPRR